VAIEAKKQSGPDKATAHLTYTTKGGILYP
jgi:hypothetical protein